MAKDDDNWVRESLENPYFFNPLYSGYRNLVKAISNWPKDEIDGGDLYDLMEHKSHDMLRQLVGWNFLAYITGPEAAEYEQSVFVGDFHARYQITTQSREYGRLELNNMADLRRAILIWVRADSIGEHQMGIERVRIKTIGFYKLVMLLNKSEEVVLQGLRSVESAGFVTMKLIYTEDGKIYHMGSDINITESGLLYLEGKANMAFNNINITNSTVGVFALQSTLNNIDVGIDNLKQRGHEDLGGALSKLTEAIAKSGLAESEKKDLLEQLELVTEETKKPQPERKPAIVKGAISYLEIGTKAVSALTTAWQVCGPLIRKYFGI
jgi:hypothetical protein